MPWTEIENAKYDMDGSAFPRFSAKPTPGGGIHYDVSGGMSLRDYFAGRASDADVSSYQNYQMDEFGEFVPRLSREEAKYAYADAMLAARNGK